MQLTVHDEINLFRLVRRLEKSVQLNNENDVRVKAQKELQKVNYARKLVKNVDGYGSSEHIRRSNSVKTALDRIEGFLKDTAAKHPPTPTRPSSLLNQLPIPQDDRQATPKARDAPSPLSLPADDNFLLSPDESYHGLPSSGLVSAIPVLMSVEPLHVPEPYRSTPSSFTSLSSTTTATALDTTPALTHRGNEAHTALQAQLSSQLEHMAAQLKRNALHFASSLEKDKAAVEDAQTKLEGNFTFMEIQRGRLKTSAGKSGGTTWLTMGIILFVLLVFMLMVGVIRLARI